MQSLFSKFWVCDWHNYRRDETAFEIVHNRLHILFNLYEQILFQCEMIYIHRKISNIRGTLVANEINDHSDVVGASPVGAAPTTSSFST